MPHIHWVARQNKLEIPRDKTGSVGGCGLKALEKLKKKNLHGGGVVGASCFWFSKQGATRGSQKMSCS
jgi:hypothetical protein